ncbi:hypothetical protein RND81_04G236900 [Saponaria officinalis]|uniref:Uncharacterized protein n=1 Tax=Saponaria officinalis TaxID=3572 RepID=A0AAW1LRL5_SAPOF
MANNVFGTPVTDATLMGMTEYHDKPIEPVDRAKVALEMKNAERKDAEARAFDERLDETLDRKGVKCLIYNATGGPVKLIAAFEYEGCVSQTPYPNIIQNGQWAAFVHEKNSNGSFGAVIYEETAIGGRQFVVGWRQRDGEISQCYGEIRPYGYYGNSSNDTRRHALRDQIGGTVFTHIGEDGDDTILSSIGNTHLPTYEAILTKTAAMVY